MKGHSRTFSKTNFKSKPEVKVRELPPRIKVMDDGVQISCPFCEIPHPIQVNQDSACGTSMRVTAVQTIYPARTVHKHNLICIKCKKSDGEMVSFNNGFVHLSDCSPGTKLIVNQPIYSKWAELVYRMPPRLRKLIERNTGSAKEVKEIDAQGIDTGKVLGYFFFKGTS